MKKILAVAGIVAMAGSAHAGTFVVNGAADFGFQAEIAGSRGGALTWEGSAAYLGSNTFDPALAPFFPHSGMRLATPDGGFGALPNGQGTQFPAGGTFQPSSLSTVVFANAAGGGTTSGLLSVGGVDYQAVQIAIFQGSLSNFNVLQGNSVAGENAYIIINSADEYVNFNEPNANGYQLVMAPVGDGAYQGLFVALIPTPGAAGLLGLAGLAAVRRRR